jgi:hypothetical protein
MKNKKGEMTLPVTIFLVLTILFFALMFFFVYKSSSGAAIYEQIYAKKIAVAIDASKPGMEIVMDISKGVEISKEAGSVGGQFRLSKSKDSVLVSLGGSGGYVQRFFSDYDVEFAPDYEKGELSIKIKGSLE